MRPYENFETSGSLTEKGTKKEGSEKTLFAIDGTVSYYVQSCRLLANNSVVTYTWVGVSVFTWESSVHVFLLWYTIAGRLTAYIWKRGLYARTFRKLAAWTRKRGLHARTECKSRVQRCSCTSCIVWACIFLTMNYLNFSTYVFNATSCKLFYYYTPRSQSIRYITFAETNRRRGFDRRNDRSFSRSSVSTMEILRWMGDYFSKVSWWQDTMRKWVEGRSLSVGGIWTVRGRILTSPMTEVANVTRGTIL